MRTLTIALCLLVLAPPKREVTDSIALNDRVRRVRIL